MAETTKKVLVVEDDDDWRGLLAMVLKRLGYEVFEAATGREAIERSRASADWIATKFGCQNRNTCPNPSYLFAEADLHNLWPELGAINSSRGDSCLARSPVEGELCRAVLPI